MGSKRPFDLQAVDDLWSRPAFGRFEDDHGPARSSRVVLAAGIALKSMDVLNGSVERGGHEFVHLLRLVSFHKVRRPATAPQELIQFLMLDAGEYGWIADLVAVQVQNWQHRPVSLWIEKLVGMPRSRQ